MRRHGRQLDGKRLLIDMPKRSRLKRGTKMKVIDIAKWKGMLLDAQREPYTKQEIKNWEEHYGGKLSVFKSTHPSFRYVLGYEGKFKQFK